MGKLRSWFGYIHINGRLQVKRYWGYKDILDAKESHFVKKVFYPFESTDREEAIKFIEEKIKENKYLDKDKLIKFLEDEKERMQDENAVKEKTIENLEWQKNLTEKAEEVAKNLFKNYLVEHEKLQGYSQSDFFCIVNFGLYIFASDLLKLFSKASGIELDTVVDVFIQGLKLRTGTLSESDIKETCKWTITCAPPGWSHVDGDDEMYCIAGCKPENIYIFSHEKNCSFCGKEIELISE